MLNFILLSIIFTALIIGSYTDIKTREVPDWLNYSLIFSGLGLRLLFSLITNNWILLLYGFLGFLFFLVIALIMFYAGQWGGGDSKMLIGLGALIGLELTFNNLLIMFLVNIIFVGSIYGLIWSLILAIKNKKNFLKQFRAIISRNKNIRKYSLTLFLIVIIVVGFFINDLFLRIFLIFLFLMFIIIFYLWIFIRAVEITCMFKLVEPEQLTEGDWIPKEIKVKGKYIAGPKDLGITKEQISNLIKLKKQNKIKHVLMKIGIPFIPSFLIAFVFSLLFGNVFLLFK
jgi:Flp pilus assembly protein protease CpaA